MRILHFCNYADVVGGAEVYAHSLIDGLRLRGHEVALFGSSPEPDVDRPGLRVIQRPVYDPLRLVLDPPARNALHEFVQRFRPDVLHVHNLFAVALEVVHYLGHCGIPAVHTVHDFQPLCPNSWCVRGDGSACPGGAGEQCFQHGCERNFPYDSWGVLLTLLQQRLCVALADVAIAPSSYLVERLRAHGWRRVQHLPYYVDFVPSPPSPSRSDHDFLYVGRLEKEKGVHVLLEAFPRIRAEVPNARLTLIGSGSMETALKQQADRLRLGASVRFLSRVPRAEIAIHHANSAVCALPSVWSENSPLVAYECLLSGLPMIGSRLGGIPELIGDCGFTFAPGDPDDLARAALRFLRLPLHEREHMSRAARARARTFDKASHLQALEDLYRGLRRADHASSLPEFPSWLELLPVLHRLGVDRVIHTPSPGATEPQSAVQLARGLARSLGLPKMFGSS